MKNWKTSLVGVIGGLIVMLPTIIKAATTPDGKVNWAQVATGAALAMVGMLAKDHNVTGGTVEQK